MAEVQILHETKNQTIMKTMKATEKGQTAAMKRMSLIAVLAIASLMPGLAQDREEFKQQDKCKGPATEIKGDHSRCACAGQKPDAQSLALHKAKRYQHELNLTNEQYNKVYKLYRQEFESMESNRSNGQKADSATLLQSKQRIDKKMAKILSEVQYAEWKEIQARHRMHAQGPAKKQGGKSGHMPGKPRFRNSGEPD